MADKLGFECKLYRNTGSYASPTWSEIENIRDLTLAMEKGEADVTTRGNDGWEAIRGALKKGSIDFGMVWDTEDAAFTAIQTAFFDDTSIEFAIMDGDIATAGSQGLRATCSVMKFTRNEQLAEAVTVDVSITPTYAAKPPQWMTVGS